MLVVYPGVVVVPAWLSCYSLLACSVNISQWSLLGVAFAPGLVMFAHTVVATLLLSGNPPGDACVLRCVAIEACASCCGAPVELV